MANKILHKRSSTASQVPSAGSLDYGELAINYTDKKLFIKDASNNVVCVGQDQAAVNTSIIPATDITYDLGSATHQWRDVYVGPGSLYVNGQKVLEENGGNIVVSADPNQNIVVQTSGDGDVELDPTGTGQIQVKGTLSITAGNSMTSSDTNPITCAVGFDMDGEKITNMATPTVASDAATKDYVDTKSVSDGGSVTGVLNVGGTTSDQVLQLTSTDGNCFMTFSDSATSGAPYIGAVGDDLIMVAPGGTGTVTVQDNLTVTGNLTVSGTTTTVNSNNVNIGDNILTLNSDETGVPSQNAGLEIERGTSTNTGIRWNETTDVWEAGNNVGTYSQIVTVSNTNYMVKDATNLPGANNTYDLGSSSFKYATIYATTFDGESTSAQYADLAEMYSAPADIEPGTVVHFGGTHEVDVCDMDHCRAVAGVVSTRPAHLMNAGADGVALALQGRVPCKVTGAVKKGDMMVSAGNGMARAEADPKVGAVIGKALEDFNGTTGVIEVAVGRL